MEAVRRFARSPWSLLVAALVGAAVVVSAWLISASGDDDRDLGGKVRVTFGRGDPQHEELLRGPFEQAIRTVNEALDLPRDIDVRVVDTTVAASMGIAGPTYVPKEHAVYFPYAFVDQSRADLGRFGHPGLPNRTSDQVLADAMVFALYHELTHGLIDTLDIPSVGGEEADGDSLATVLSIAAGRGQGAYAPLSVAALESDQGKRAGRPGLAQYADDHELAQQRAVDALCLVYGSDPARHRALVGGPEGLPDQRSQACQYDYQQELRSWQRLLADHLSSLRALRAPNG